eukprot:657419-Amphidinium_carterae.1
MGALDMKVGAPKRGPKTPPQRVTKRADGRMPWQIGPAAPKAALAELEVRVKQYQSQQVHKNISGSVAHSSA